MTLLAWTIITFLGVVILAVIVATPSPDIPRSDGRGIRRIVNRGGN
jgi:hypothetical protein